MHCIHTSIRTLASGSPADLRGDPAIEDEGLSEAQVFRGKIREAIFLIAIAGAMVVLSGMAHAQALLLPDAPVSTDASVSLLQSDLSYERPSEKVKFENYLFDAYGPYPIAGSAIAAADTQIGNEPQEWGPGAEGYGKRIGSNFAIAVIATSTRYGLAEALREDTLYYRCQCSGFFPRLRHAMVSAVTGRRGSDGRRVFSVPALVSPYVGSMAAVAAWYPDRFSAKDAFRMGNYSLLSYAGQNLALEFIYRGPRSLIARLHLNDTHGAADPGPNH